MATRRAVKVTTFKRGRKKKCSVCVSRMEEVDYKDINTLRRYLTDRGKIAPRRMSGLCPNTKEQLQQQLNKLEKLVCYLT